MNNFVPLTTVLNQDKKMPQSQTVHCPTCGSHALRQQILHLNVTETACPVCDYLLVSCLSTGNVLESYAPGIKR
ncbi:MAG: replication restart DNA helicase PriA [Microcystaceae cyanobacterium]